MEDKNLRKDTLRNKGVVALVTTMLVTQMVPMQVMAEGETSTETGVVEEVSNVKKVNEHKNIDVTYATKTLKVNQVGAESDWSSVFNLAGKLNIKELEPNQKLIIQSIKTKTKLGNSWGEPVTVENAKIGQELDNGDVDLEFLKDKTEKGMQTAFAVDIEFEVKTSGATEAENKVEKFSLHKEGVIAGGFADVKHTESGVNITFPKDVKVQNYELGSASESTGVLSNKITLGIDKLTEAEQVLKTSTVDVGNGVVSYEITIPEKDTVKPVIEIAGVEQGKTYGEKTTVRVTVKDKFIDESGLAIESTGVAGNWQKIEGGYAMDVKFDEEGVHKIKVSAKDRSGNTEEKVVGFNVDLEDPVISIKNLKSGYYNKTITAEISIKELFLLKPNITCDTSGELGEWKREGTYWKNTVTFSSEGSHHIKVEAQDILGKRSIADINGIVIDKTAPTYTVEGMPQKEITGKEVVLKLIVDELNFDPSKVEVETEGTLGSWSEVDGKHVNTITYKKDGVFPLKINVTDKAGNKAQETKFKNINLDMTPPKITVEGAESGFFKDTKKATITLEDSNLDDKDINIETEGTVGNIQTVDAKTKKVEVTFDKEGTYSLKVSAKDKAGNISSSNEYKNIVIDKTAPIVNVEGAESNSYNNMPKVVMITIDDENFDPATTEVTTAGETTDWKQSGKTWYKTVSFTKDGEYNLTVTAKDKAGNVSTPEVLSNVVIDTTAPVISFTGVEKKLYGTNVVGMFTVKDRNFKPELAKISTTGKVGKWTEENGVWSAPVTFTSEEGVQSFNAVAKDLAGNQSENVSFSGFEIDKTAPKLSLSWDKTNANGYYNSRRTATLTVEDKHFDPAGLQLNGASVSSWSHNGNSHVATVVFDKDGEYSFSAKATDKAGNTSNAVESGKFTVDTLKPEIVVSGVQKGVSYKGNVNFSVIFKDKNIDLSKCSATLVGRKGKKLELKKTDSGYAFAGVPDGKSYDDFYTLKMVGYDLAGNSVEETLTFSINRYGSDFKFVDAKLLNSYIKKARNIVVKEYSVDELDTNALVIKVFRNGEEIKVPKDLIKIDKILTDRYEYSYTIDKKVFNKDGKYLVQVFSKTKDGKESASLKETFAFILDSTAPKILIGGIENGKLYREYSKKATIEVRDLSPIEKLDVKVNGKSVKVTEEKDGLYSIELKESKDKYNVEVTAVDKAGNKSSEDVKDVLITSSWLLIVWNVFYLKYVLPLLALIAGIIAFILGKKKRDERKKELASVASTVSSFGTTGSGSGSTETGTEDTETK